MSGFEDVALAGRALRPDFYQYVILYTSRAAPGLHAVCTWSPNSLVQVREAFLYEFASDCPTVLFINSPGSC